MWDRVAVLGEMGMVGAGGLGTDRDEWKTNYVLDTFLNRLLFPFFRNKENARIIVCDNQASY